MTLERTIAGHRVLRLLGRGARSRVWLVAGDLVLKVLSAPVAAGQPGREAQALYRARDEHVVELIDVSVQADEVVLVHPRLPRGSLADILAARQSLDAGEAVTILAPVAAALARMHEAGVAHGAVSAEHVLFRADGAPVLIGFGDATLFEPGLPEVTREQIDGVLDDRRALATLADAVLGRVTGARASAFAETLHAGGLQDLEVRLSRGLFELAAARPVVFDADESDAAGSRAIEVRAVPEPPAPTAPGLLGQVLESGPVSLARNAVRSTWSGWSPGRRRAMIGMSAGLFAVVVAVAALPGAPAPADEVAAPTPIPSDVIVATADDPLDALGQLMRRRQECLRDLSVLCLEDVDEPGSAAFDDDQQAIQAVIGAGTQPSALSATGARIVERLGDSVLIALAPDSEPASVLLMRGEAGWRVRDYLPPML